jgi:hypothetical protein
VRVSRTAPVGAGTDRCALIVPAHQVVGDGRRLPIRRAERSEVDPHRYARDRLFWVIAVHVAVLIEEPEVDLTAPGVGGSAAGGRRCVIQAEPEKPVSPQEVLVVQQPLDQRRDAVVGCRRPGGPEPEPDQRIEPDPREHGGAESAPGPLTPQVAQSDGLLGDADETDT